MAGNNLYSESDPDFTKAAADHLRSVAKERGLEIGSSHAHALVAASLGYQSRVAFLSPTSEHWTGDPWLYLEEPNQVELGAAVTRMRKGAVEPDHVLFLAGAIRDGLAPPCSETGLRSAKNIPLGCVDKGDDATDVEWVHPSQARDRERFDHCRCCGSDYLYRIEDLDEHGLCEVHKGEFDLDEEEQKDWDDLIENMTKDL